MQLRQIDEFVNWLARLRDKDARRRIEARLDRIANTGNLGDVRYVGKEVSEIRLYFGPGYRLYFTQRGDELVFLLLGGDKSTQSKDILRAQALAVLLDK